MEKETSIPKLTALNAYSWMQQMDIFFRQKKLGRFLKYGEFEEWHRATHVISEQEGKYHQRQKAIDLDKSIDEKVRRDKTEALEDKFHNDLSLWSNNRAKALEQWNLEQEQASGFIKGAVDTSYWPMLKKCETTKAMWDLLKKETTATEVGNVMILHGEFFKAKLSENEGLVAYISRVQVITEKLSDIEEPLSESLICYKVLSSLSEDYNNLTQTLYQIPKKDLTIQLLKSKFAMEDSRQASKSQVKDAEEAHQAREVQRKCNECKEVLSSSHAPNHNKCNPCFKKYLEKRKNESTKRTEREVKEKAQQAAAAEKKKKKDQKQKNKRWSNSSSESASVAMVERLSAMKNEVQKTNHWYMDSGATVHFSNELTEMSEIEKYETKYTGPTGEVSRATKRGQCHLRIADAYGLMHPVSLSKVVYDPSLERKLMSVNKLTENGLRVVFSESSCKVYRGNRIVMTGEIDETGLYAMNVMKVQSANLASRVKSLKEWHIRLGHLSIKKIKELVRNGSIDEAGIKGLDSEFSCHVCDEAKMKRKNFDKKGERKQQSEAAVGEVFHTDVCGKISPPSLGNKNYFVTHLDEKSGFIFVKTIARKNEALGEFQRVRNLVKSRLKTKVIRLKSDGGGEYVSREYEDFTKAKGIDHQVTPKNTPQYNARAERLNKLLCDPARAMLKEKNLPARFWGEAIIYAAHILNRTIAAGSNRTKSELFLKEKSSISLKKIKTFGTPVTYANNDPHKKKLEDRGLKGIFVGINASGTYRIYDIKSKRVVSSRDVKFYEDEVFEFSEEEENMALIIEDSEEDDMVEDVSADILFRSAPILPPVVPLTAKPLILCKPTRIQPKRGFIPMAEPASDPLLKKVDLFEKSEEVLSIIAAPKSYSDVLESDEKARWLKSMNSEVESILERKVFDSNKMMDERDVPAGKSIVSSKWVFKVKELPNGDISCFKTRLVARGFTQTRGIDYEETFAPVISSESQRLLLNFSLNNGFGVDHLDVKTAFLYGELKEDVYLRLPQEFGMFMKLEKAIYGLKQAPQCWNDRVTKFFLSKSFEQSKVDPCIFYLRNASEQIIAAVGIYVDDSYVVGSSQERKLIKEMLMSEFSMVDNGPLTHLLGMSVLNYAN